MNRIILIGNGFDLAHGMSTSYNHFINDYWEKIIEGVRNNINGNITTRDSILENDEIKISNIPSHWNIGRWNDECTTFEGLIDFLKHLNLKLEFKNIFLEILTRKKSIQNWVDIEKEYYYLLKESYKDENCSYKIDVLNNDFERIKQLLEDYLKGIENNFLNNFSNSENSLKLKSSIGSKIYSEFKLKDFTESSINKKAEIEFQNIQNDIKGLKDGMIEEAELNEESRRLIYRIGKEKPQKEIRKLLVSDYAYNFFNLMPEEILFLNFNYTFTEKLYLHHNEFDYFDSKKAPKKQIIHIHGTTDKHDGNNVIFGFGDEIDDDYKSIENLNDNIYLENIKSIKYLETDNYKRLLEFLNSGDYQIFIFGHSCGISDRTLLNTLFEHKHCCSVKPFYHKKADGTDNYSDIVRNITRNFNSKSVLRDKVVNKEYCEPLS
ncbi:AbiH family protein [Flavobacterium sp. NRK F7]|uniref:AbiH family protein n=1 Tax=Flavobacterium sp. NRK F7 TaxID=2954930 RepID=UPI0020905C5E|nr:AbiH family protein [Flavobacterium sp. NRK F7]MCO6164247.1 bacteriophage abortive infection AbiH family protein [Flavobacterium sp. NRK F7]